MLIGWATPWALTRFWLEGERLCSPSTKSSTTPCIWRYLAMKRSYLSIGASKRSRVGISSWHCRVRSSSLLPSTQPSGPSYRKMALPSPEKPSLSLTTARIASGWRPLSTARARATSCSSRSRSKPSGMTTPASRKTSRQPDLLPRSARSGSLAYSGMPSATASERSRGELLKQERWAVRGSPSASRRRRSKRGRASSLAERGVGEASAQYSRVRRRRAWAAGMPESRCR